MTWRRRGSVPRHFRAWMTCSLLQRKRWRWHRMSAPSARPRSPNCVTCRPCTAVTLACSKSLTTRKSNWPLASESSKTCERRHSARPSGTQRQRTAFVRSDYRRACSVVPSGPIERFSWRTNCGSSRGFSEHSGSGMQRLSKLASLSSRTSRSHRNRPTHRSSVLTTSSHTRRAVRRSRRETPRTSLFASASLRLRESSRSRASDHKLSCAQRSEPARRPPRCLAPAVKIARWLLNWRVPTELSRGAPSNRRGRTARWPNRLSDIAQERLGPSGEATGNDESRAVQQT